MEMDRMPEDQELIGEIRRRLRISAATSWRCGRRRSLPTTHRQRGGQANDEPYPLLHRAVRNAAHSRAGPGNRSALIVGGATFDRLFAGVRFDEVDGDVLYVYARGEEVAAEMEDNFALHISIVATAILKREIGIVLVLPEHLIQ
jgi:hypothetical protein